MRPREMDVQTLHQHLRCAFSGASGEIALEWLRENCCMVPSPTAGYSLAGQLLGLDGSHTLAFQAGRQSLYQSLAYLLDDQRMNEPKDTPRRA